MLRITTEHGSDGIHIRLEGRLEGPWVDLLRDCWRSEVARSPHKLIHLDLNAVIFISLQGKELLREMYKGNTRFTASDPVTNAILGAITEE